MVDAAFIETTIRAVLPHAKVVATDLTGGGDHWHAVVSDAAFTGLRPLARQRLVLAAFTELIEANIVHALDLRCLAPGE